jgi:SAM-dependent methyltransferase
VASPAIGEEEEKFAAVQARAFADAERQRYLWMTTNPLIAAREGALLGPLRALAAASDRVLEVGCGEGANMAGAARAARRLHVGLDYGFEKVRYWRANLTPRPDGESVAGLCADATRLPVPDAAFDLVYCRDVLHHVPYRLQGTLVAEMVRACRRGGTVVMIEANGRNPVITMHALLLPQERGELKVSPKRIETLLRGASGAFPSLDAAEPMPVFRVLAHHRYGFPKLGSSRAARRVFELLDGAMGRLLPRDRWAYCVASITKP